MPQECTFSPEAPATQSLGCALLASPEDDGISPDQCWWGMWLSPNALSVLSILSNLSTLKQAGLFLAALSPSEWWAGGKPGCPPCWPVTQCQVGCTLLLGSGVPSPSEVCHHSGVWGGGLRPRPGLRVHLLDTTLLSSLVFNCHCCTFKGVCPNGQEALSGSPSGVSDGFFMKSTFSLALTWDMQR